MIDETENKVPRISNLFKLGAKNREQEIEVDSNLYQDKMLSVNSAITQAEIAVIGAILIDNELYFTVAEVLSEDDFSDEITKLVFECIVNILEGRVSSIGRADALIISQMPGVSKLIRFPTLKTWCLDSLSISENSELLSSYVTIIENASAERKLQSFLDRSNGLIGKNISAEQKSLEIADALESETRKRKKTKSSTRSAGDCAADAVKGMIAHAKLGSAISGLPLGMGELDLMLSGFNDTDLIIIAARPAVGKTAFVLSVLNNISKLGHPSLMYSLEMSGVQLSKRMLGMVSNVDGSKIRSASLNESEWDKVIEASKTINDYPLHFNEDVETSLSALRTQAIRLKREKNIKLLVVDYLQLMSGNSKENRQAQISDISRGLKKLAGELHLPVIALSQLNRNLESRADRTPMLSDLRESGSLEQDADVIIFLHEADSKKRTSDGKKVIDAIIAKQRSGPVGSVSLLFDERITHYSALN